MAGDQDAIRALTRELAIVEGQQTAHEKVCTERMVRIDERHETMSKDIGTVKEDVKAVLLKMDTFVNRSSATAWKMNWKAWALAGAMISALVGALAWETGQLYHMQVSAAHGSPTR